MTAERKTVPPRRPRVHDGVVGTLARRILSGEAAPGSGLPNTALLSAHLGISRGALREAVRVLGAKGLVEMRPGTGTRIRPSEEWHLLDPEVLAWGGADLAPHIVRSLLECRLLIEPGAAAIAATRATAKQLAVIEGCYERMAATLPHDVDACCDADLAFHVALFRATDNAVLAQLAAAISAALLATFRLSTRLADSHQEAMSAHRDVVEAIRMRDPGGATQAINRVLGKSARHLRTVLASPEAAGQAVAPDRR